MKPDISHTIHYYRKQSGLTQQQLAQMAGVGKTVVYDIEKGKLSVQLDTLQKILKVLNIELSLLPPFPMKTEDK